MDPTAATTGHAWEPSPEAHPEPVPLVSDADLVNPMLTVAEVMSAGPRTCSPFSTAVEAALVLRETGCEVIPVVDAGKAVGALSDRGLALALPEHGGDLSRLTAGDLMSADPVTIDPGASLGEALGRMTERGARWLLAVDGDGLLHGLLTWSDLAAHVSERGLGRLAARAFARR